MHSKRSIAFTTYGFVTWALSFIFGALMIATDFHLAPGIDHRRLMGFIIFLCCCIVMGLQTYSALSLFRAFSFRPREINRWDALLYSLLGWAINFWVASQASAYGLVGLIGDLASGED